jgi:S1-C subfamily serine protease
MSYRIIITLLLIIPFWTASSAEAGSLSEIFKKVKPSVVVIETKQIIKQSQNMTVKKEGIGSGFLISDDGLIMTVAHVVQTADTITVKFSDGQIVSANVVASEPAADVSLLRLEQVPDNAVAAKLGDSDSLQH